MALKPGDVIQLSDEEQQTYKVIQDRLVTARFAFWEASREMQDINATMFNTIRMQHPELIGVEFTVGDNGMCVVTSVK